MDDKLLQNDVPWADVARGTPDALIYADREGIIRGWNPGATAIFGFDHNDTLGENLDVIIPPHLRARHWAAFKRALAAGKTRGGARVRMTRALHKSGKRLYVEMSFGVVLSAEGESIGSVAMARDGTERYLTEHPEKRDA